MKVRLIASTLALLAVVSIVRAQEPAKPGPEHEKFKEMVGEWEATVNFGGMEMKGSATYKLDFGGFFLIEEFEGDFGGMKFKGRSQAGYCPIKKKYFSTWIDNMSASPVMMSGNFDKEGKTLTEEGEGPGMDGKMMKMKSVGTLVDKDTMVFKMFTVNDGKDTEMMTITYKRKK